MIKKDNKRKFKFLLLSTLFFIFFINLISANSLDYCKVLGNCPPSTAKSIGGNTTIFQNITNINQTTNITNNITNNITQQAANYSILSDWANLTNIPLYVKDWNSTGYIKNWDPNGYIKDWNLSGLIKDWNNTGLIINWSSLLNGTGLIKDWNFTGFIKDWNMSGYIQNWNNTGLILNWSNIITGGSGITNGSSAWLQNLSLAGDFLVDNNALEVNATNNFVGINTSNAQNTLNVVGTTNISNGDLIVDESTFLVNGTSNLLTVQNVGIGTSTLIGKLTVLEGTISSSVIGLQSSTPIGYGIVGNSTRASPFGDFGVGVLGSGRGSGVISHGNFIAVNRSSSIPQIDSSSLYPYTLIVAGNINRTGLTRDATSGDYALNMSLTYVRIGNILNITNTGNQKLPPFTGAGNQGSFCSNATNSAFNGTIMKNNTGVYGCPMTASANWTKLF